MQLNNFFHSSLSKKNLLSRHHKLSLLFVIFIFGFGWASLYVPVILLYLFLYNRNSISLRMNIYCWINYFSILFFILFTYLFGMGSLTVDSPVGTFSVVFFLALVIIPIFNIANFNYSLNLLMVFLLGIFAYVLSVVAFTLLTIPIQFGIKSLVSPFFPGLMFNTPSFSNYLAIVFCGFFCIFIFGRGLLVKVSSFLILIVSFFMAIFLGGRAFFLIAFVFIAFFSFNLKLRNKYLIIGLFSMVLITLISYTTNVYPLFSEALVLKLDDGLESSRYEHWRYALTNIPIHPFGGFGVNQQIEEIYSFHNIIFDAARLAGWFSILLIFIIFGINLLTYFFMRKIDSRVYFLWLFSVAVALVMMQDVILEGTYKYIIIYSLISHIIIKCIANKITTSVKANEI